MDKKPLRRDKGGAAPKRKGLKNFGFVALLILIGLIVFAAYGQPSTLKDVSLSDVVKSGNAGE